MPTDGNCAGDAVARPGNANEASGMPQTVSRNLRLRTKIKVCEDWILLFIAFFFIQQEHWSQANKDWSVIIPR